MTRPDLDEFAALWHSEPDPLEQEQMQAYARAARRRGKLLGYLDAAWAALVFTILLGGVFVSPSPLTIAIGLPLMLATIWLSWKRRQMRQMARTLNTSTPEAFVASSLANARANLRRVTISVASIPFLVPVALAFKVSMRTGGGPQEIWEALLLWTHTIRAPITLVVLLTIAAFSLRSRGRIKREMRRLEGLRRGYEAEADEEG
ncbi:MAG TPA: hypothetical protein VF680_03285 [Allosphingosinicella sp.]|jgi:hypothetical protein